MDLAEIEKYGKLLLTYQEICILSPDIDIEDITNPETEIYRAYHRGRLYTEMLVREEIIEAAQNGSPDAQEKLIKMINNTKINNTRYE